MTISDDEGFEIIDAPFKAPISMRPKRRPKHKGGRAACSNPFCQLSHSSKENEIASERALEPLIEIMQANANHLETQAPIFRSGISSLAYRDIIFDTFVNALPVNHRGVMNCSSCKLFLRHYGDLCVVGDDGGLVPLVFPTHSDVPPYYRKAVRAVVNLFAKKTVTEEFSIRTEAARILGCPTKGDWPHMSVVLGKIPIVPLNGTMSPQDAETSFRMLNQILKDHSSAVVSRVYQLIHDKQLPNAEPHKGAIAFLKKVDYIRGIKNTIARQNLVTKYACTAFPGCLSSLRGGMLGYLLDCVSHGHNFDMLKRGWTSKANSLSYLRPKSAPSTGNIESAEKIFARLGYTPRDLERVFLTMDQIPKSAILWESGSEYLLTSKEPETTLPEEPATQKLFGNLRPFKDPAFYTDSSIKKVSFRHFALKILPTVSTIEILPTNLIQPYFFTTGKPGAKPIFNFHSESEGAHTAAWYSWGKPGAPSKANLKHANTAVKAIITFPHLWDGLASRDIFDDVKIELFTFKRLGIRLLFVLDGAKQIPPAKLCLFPALMRADLHSVRKTVEAFSNKGRVEFPERNVQHVGGLSIAKNKDMGEKGMVVEVRTKTNSIFRYRITSFE